MKFDRYHQNRLNCGNIWIIGAFILLISPALYGFDLNHNAGSPHCYEPKNDSSPIDTLTKFGFTIQVNGQNIVVADEDLPTRVDWKEAQTMCGQLGNGWRLPSNDELDAMYNQLHLQGQGNFYPLGYWSNQEVDTTNAWVMYFLSREKHPTRKLMPIKVRPVRTP
ncbi:MAG: DUF1566 domain-containing protein [Bacteroidota bacterium]